MSEPSPWALDRIGVVVGDRYRVERLIGEGAMGAVFAARHVTLGKLLAVKLMPPEDKFEAEAARRFEQEAVAAASVARKGVVDVLDFGVDPKVGPYIVMELLEGESLEARIRREKSLSGATTIALLAPVLDALSSVHARSIIHRDLKPANLFVARDEEGAEVVKILDFGVSRVREGKRAPTTATGVVIGTPRFMAPEQAKGIADLDLRADLYAVGAIAYACLAGKPPYADLGYIDVIAAILSEPPTPLAQLVPNIAPGLLAVIEKAMARDREERFANAAEMRTALIMAGRPSHTPADPAATVAARPSATVDVARASVDGVPPTRNETGPLVTRADVPSPMSPAGVTHMAGAPSPQAPVQYAPQQPLQHAPVPATAPPYAQPPRPPTHSAPFAPPIPHVVTGQQAPHNVALAPAPHHAAMVHARPVAGKKSGRGWIVAIALLVTLFVGFAAFTVWWWTVDEEVEGAG
ncbi:MAG: protein kinase [Myxococcales bacterium]|nr:protein kinase [Myxococcales bacterium]